MTLNWLTIVGAILFLFGTGFSLGYHRGKRFASYMVFYYEYETGTQEQRGRALRLLSKIEGVPEHMVGELVRKRWDL